MRVLLTDGLLGVAKGLGLVRLLAEGGVEVDHDVPGCLVVDLPEAGEDGTASGMSAKALRAIGIGTSDLSEVEASHREKYRRKILSRVVPYGVVKRVLPGLQCGQPNGSPAAGIDDMAPVAILTIGLIAPVAEKIVRGSSVPVLTVHGGDAP